MKNIISVIVSVLIVATVLFLFRYEITVHSPIIVKLDRWTGNAWVANSGVWMNLEHKIVK